MTVSVLTYNILADAYLRPEWYAGVAPEVLEPARRRRALLSVLVEAHADVLCLQEVEPEVFEHLASGLEPVGYAGHYGQKRRGRPDGCATFVRTERFEAHHAKVLHYADGEGRGGDSGHVALMVTLGAADLSLGIANTHLRWDPPEVMEEDRWAIRQVGALVAAMAGDGGEWIVCGDFNVSPGDPALAHLERAGFADAHRSLPRWPTCCANGQGQTLDYLCHSSGLVAAPAQVADIRGVTLLPSPAHPSDHMPLCAQFAAAPAAR